MGRPSTAKKHFNAAPPSYRDDVDTDDAVSLHTTASDITYDEQSGLPSYSDSEGTQQHKTHSEPVDQYQSVRPPAPISSLRQNGNKSASPSAAIGCETSLRLDARLMDPEALYDYVTNYLRRVPPRQLVRLQGWHWERRETTQSNGKRDSNKERVHDFDLVFDLKEYLPDPQSGAEFENWAVARVLPDEQKALRGSMFKTTRPPAPQPLSISADTPEDVESGGENDNDTYTRDDDDRRLRVWCNDFARSKAVLKTFRITRNVLDLDTTLLTERLTGLVRSTGYRGHVDVTLPLSNRYIDIYSPHWINSARVTTWIRWVFFLTFLWLFSWPVIWLLERKWAVYEIDWSFSRVIVSSSSSSARPTKRYARGVSEEQWVSTHADLIQALACEGFQGEATDLNPCGVDPRRKTRAAQLRMPALRAGNGTISNAVNFMQGGVAAFNVLSGRENSLSTGWGADETY